MAGVREAKKGLYAHLVEYLQNLSTEEHAELAKVEARTKGGVQNLEKAVELVIKDLSGKAGDVTPAAAEASTN